MTKIRFCVFIAISALMWTALTYWPRASAHKNATELIKLLQSCAVANTLTQPQELMGHMRSIRRLLADPPSPEALVDCLRDPKLSCQARFHATLAIVGSVEPDFADRLLSLMLLAGPSKETLALQGEGTMHHSVEGPLEHCLRQIAYSLAGHLPATRLSDDEFYVYAGILHDYGCGGFFNNSPEADRCLATGHPIPNEHELLSKWPDSGSEVGPNTYCREEVLRALQLQSPSERSHTLKDTLVLVCSFDLVFPGYTRLSSAR